MIDEGAEFFGDRKQGRVYEMISKIARLGRFAGIHLIISTQRADVEAMPQQIRSMLVTRVIFKVSQKEDSIMFIGNADAFACECRLRQSIVWFRSIKIS